MSVEQESLSEIIKSPFVSAQPKAATDEKPSAESPAETAAPSAAKEEVKAEEKSEAKPDRSRDENGRFAKAEDKPAKAELPKADLAAIMDERRKRQALEQRIRELESKPEAKKPSVFEDEDKAISSRVDEGTRELREKLFKQSVKLAKLSYKETYGDAEQAFMEAAEQDERLVAALRASDDPGEYIYTVGLQIRELADVGGDFMKYREKIAGGYQSQLDEMNKQLAALKAENESLKTAQKDLDSVPRSLNERSSGPAPKPGSLDPEALSSIVRFGKPNR